jgi:hypothetical protein
MTPIDGFKYAMDVKTIRGLVQIIYESILVNKIAIKDEARFVSKEEKILLFKLISNSIFSEDAFQIANEFLACPPISSAEVCKQNLDTGEG